MLETGTDSGVRVPLAERMRPQNLSEYVGQSHLLDPGRVLRVLIEGQTLRSLVLWGPPGTGKTTLARLYAQATGALFQAMSAVSSGVKDVRAALEEAGRARRLGISTLIFIDEIHRFSRAQQDALLPAVEEGLITLVGATTENPGFSVNDALLSRMRVLQLNVLSPPELEQLMRRALEDSERGLGASGLSASDELLSKLAEQAGGDARWVLSTLEVAADLAVNLGRTELELADIEEAAQRRALRYDKTGDNHYQIVSAFIKSMRGSDVDAALYYMLRMIESGEEPLFVLRRIVIFASEDIGNADPRALQVAVSAMEAFKNIGMPEGILPMTQAVTYLATAPKSNAVIAAYSRARTDLRRSGDLPLPKHLINPANPLMRQLGYGAGYRYPHNYDGNYVDEVYRPEAIQGNVYYEPSGNGHEAQIRDRMRRWRQNTSEG